MRAGAIGIAVAASAFATSGAAAQDHAHHGAPAGPAAGAHAAPGQAAAPDPHASHRTPQPTVDAHAGHEGAQPGVDPHAGHANPAPADPHAGHGAAAPALPRTGPPPPSDHAADAIYSPEAMEQARRQLRLEHGGARVSKLMADVLEYRTAAGGGYRWEVEGWYGGDIHRAVVRTEGEGGSDHGLEEAEVQLLYSRAVTRYTDLQFGLRQDLEPRGRTYAAAGFETLLRYWFEVEGAIYLSDRGDLLAEVEGSYDLRLAQRLVLQGRVEAELAAQDVPETMTGLGVASAEVGLRLRYEVRREFAPYVGVTYGRRFGRSADFARAAGEDPEEASVVVGIRTWL